jgi:hypothetical protein
VDIPISVWTEIGPWGLVSGFVILVAVGGLVPRWVFNRVLTEKDKIIDGKDAVIVKLEAALDKRDEQFERIFTQTEIIVKLLEDLKHAGQPHRTG